jgi:hypothetical protein
MSEPTDEELRSIVRSAVSESVAEAVAEGIRKAMTDKEALSSFWQAAIDQLQEQAQRRTGQMVWAGVKSFFSRKVLMVIAILVALKVGGVEFAGKVWKLLNP